MKVYLIVGIGIDLDNYPFEKDSFLVGVDRGAIIAVRSGINLDLAVGDFDSVTYEEMEFIKKNSKKIVSLNPVKDDTDTYHAYSLVKDKGDSIVILGGIQGRRIEHFVALLNLVKDDKKVSILDSNSLIYRLDSKTEPYMFTKNEYKFISLFPVKEADVTLKGFSYPLKDYVLKGNDSLCISNEIKDEEGLLFLKKGSVLVILSKDDDKYLN